MATKIQSLPMAVVFKMVKADLMESYRTHDVQVLSIGLCDSEELDDADNEQSIMVMATVNSDEECFAKDCGTHPWVLTWDEDECCFCYSHRWDQDEDDDGELPENVVERCNYVGITMDENWSDCNVDVEAELKVPVKLVRWNYPFEVKEGSYNVYPLDIEVTTWGDLLTSITEVFQREYAEHESEKGHALGDYIIELLEIHPNGLATVSFGS